MAASIVQNMMIVGGAGGGDIRLMHVTPDATPVPYTPRAIVVITEKPVSKMVMQSSAPAHSTGLVWIEFKSVALVIIGKDGSQAVELIRAWISTGTEWIPIEGWHTAHAVTGQWTLFSTAILPLPQFTYTGNSELIDDGGGNWRIKFLTSGTLTLADKRDIDVFLVGGGGGGAKGSGNYKGGGGGGGGLIQTIHSAPLTASQGYQITVGGGGSGGTSAAGGVGGTSTFLSYSAAGGNGGNGGETQTGGSGGGGGGGGMYSATGQAGNGGSNGNAGGSSTGAYTAAGGTGSGITTREFGDPSLPLYSGGGGGGGGRDTGGTYGQNGSGGAGGGGAGSKGAVGVAGTTNLGGGGGGGGYSQNGGAGGSGIVIIRNARG